MFCRLSTAIALILSALPVAAQDSASWALQGYDPVAYLTEGKAEPGRAEIHTYWQGAIWLFESEAHRASFEANPRAYAPGFGGLCPVALAEGEKRPGLPELFAVIGDRLYLLSSAPALQQLQEDPRDILSRARRVFAGAAP